MLRFEREAVAALTTSPDTGLRRSVEHYVDRRLRAMPDFLRIGLAFGSVVLDAWSRALDLLPTGGPHPLRTRLDGWESGSLSPVRSWVRLFRSLVLYAEHELPGTT